MNFVLLALRRVECVNCGDSDLDRFLVAVAVLSVLIALYAAWKARQSAETAQEQLGMMRTEHQHFLAEKAKRPELGATVEVVSEASRDEDGRVFTVEASTLPTEAIVQLGWSNTGDKAADDATLNFLYPKGVVAHHCEFDGTRRRPISGVLETPEFLIKAEQGDHSRFLYWNQGGNRIAPGDQTVQYFVLTLHDHGHYPIGFLINAPALDDSVIETRAIVVKPTEDGEAYEG